MKFTLFLAFAAACSAQTVTIDDVSPSSPTVQAVFGRDAVTGNVLYTCVSPSRPPNTTRISISVPISGIAKGSPTVVASPGHGFHPASKPSVTIRGASGPGWAAINSTFAATIIDVDSFSVPIDTTAFGDLTGTITFITTAPRLNVKEWRVRLFAYAPLPDGTNPGQAAFWGTLPVWEGWLNGLSTMDQKCSDATAPNIPRQ